MVTEEVKSIQDERKRAVSLGTGLHLSGDKDRFAWVFALASQSCGLIPLIHQSFLTQLSEVLTTQLGNSFRLEICIRMDPLREIKMNLGSMSLPTWWAATLVARVLVQTRRFHYARRNFGFGPGQLLKMLSCGPGRWLS